MITTCQGHTLLTGDDVSPDDVSTFVCVGCERPYFHGYIPAPVGTLIDCIVLWGDEAYCFDCFNDGEPLPSPYPERPARDYAAEYDDAIQDAAYNRRKPS